MVLMELVHQRVQPVVAWRSLLEALREDRQRQACTHSLRPQEYYLQASAVSLAQSAGNLQSRWYRYKNKKKVE